MTATNEFYDRISSLIQQARQRFKTAVNLAMVYTYYEIGMNIVEEEQNGRSRAVYGTSLLKGLSEYLTDRLGSSYSEDNLKLMRRFYLVYSDDEIRETLFPQFANLPMTTNGRHFYLSWSHYIKLMRITDVDERHFYELEAVNNDWSLSELKRQYNSSLYERLVLSSDKEKVLSLSRQGQVVESPTDLVKIRMCWSS